MSKLIWGTRLGRFLLGGFLGVVSILLLISVMTPYSRTIVGSLKATLFIGNWLVNLGFSDNDLVLGIAFLLAISACSIVLSFLYRHWKMTQVFLSIPLFTVFGVWVLTRLFPLSSFANAGIFTPGPPLAMMLIMFGPIALGCGIRMAIGNRAAFGEGTLIRGTDKLKGDDKRIQKKLLKFSLEESTPSDQGIYLWSEVFLPFSKENHHILIAGSPGSGKTQITFPIIKQVFNRKAEKIIIWDVKGTYIQALANEPGVSILAPWDKRSIAWRPGADIIRPLDCHQASHVLIPINPREPQPYFNNAARNILEAVLIQLDAQGSSWGWQDVWNVISKSKNDLYSFLQRTQEGRSAASTVEGDSKAGQDVYSTLISHLKPVSWLAKAWGNEGISLRTWLKDPTSKTLIIGGMVENEELAAITARLALQILVNEVLAMPDDLNRRAWLFLDELAALGSSESLLKAFSTGRSKGLCVVAGIQDIGKIEHLYSHELAKSITNSFTTNIFLRCSDAATSQWASDAIGHQETADLISETTSGKLNKSRNTSVRNKPTFLPSEIANFSDLTGVLRVSGWPVAKVKWPLNPISQSQPRVVDAHWVNQKAKIDNLSIPEQKSEPPKDEPRKIINPWDI